MNNEDAILARLDELKERVGRLDERQERDGRETRKQLVDLRVAVASLKVKAGVWGAIAGLIPAAVVAIYVITKAMVR